MYLKSQNATGYAVLCEEWQTYDQLLITWSRLCDLVGIVREYVGEDARGVCDLEMIIRAIKASAEQDESINQSLTFHPGTNNAEKQ